MAVQVESVQAGVGAGIGQDRDDAGASGALFHRDSVAICVEGIVLSDLVWGLQLIGCPTYPGREIVQIF
jgi:hypothetical protein